MPNVRLGARLQLDMAAFLDPEGVSENFRHAHRLRLGSGAHLVGRSPGDAASDNSVMLVEDLAWLVESEARLLHAFGGEVDAKGAI